MYLLEFPFLNFHNGPKSNKQHDAAPVYCFQCSIKNKVDILFKTVFHKPSVHKYYRFILMVQPYASLGNTLTSLESETKHYIKMEVIRGLEETQR